MAVLENQNKALIEELKSLKELYTGGFKQKINYSKLLCFGIQNVENNIYVQHFQPDVVYRVETY